MEDPFAGLDPALLRIGLETDGYAAISRAEADLIVRTGHVDLGCAFLGRQVVNRFFIAGFGSPTQCAAWLGRTAAVAISEPGVGAHPKHLTTTAEPIGAGWRLNGEKAWASNGPFAAVFVVLAVMAVENGRKRYGAFLVPRDAPGLTLHPSETRHCGLSLRGCVVPRDALLGLPDTAYEKMALSFRDVEDAVGLSGLGGALRFIIGRLGGEAHALGGLIALNTVLEAGATRVAEALDAGELATHAAEAIGLRLLAAEIVERVRRHRDEFGPSDDAPIERALAELALGATVARGPRAARQARLAEQR